MECAFSLILWEVDIWPATLFSPREAEGMIDVLTFYTEHPINEGEILLKLERDGKSTAAPAPEDLFPYDQDHYGGLPATDALAAALELGPGLRVLDVCSGVGGASRYLAHRYGCVVHGVDLNETRLAGARRLTALTGLDDRVTFSLADAAALDLEPGSFDAAVSQEAFLHIPDREGLLSGCRRVLRPGGKLGFTDWIAFESLAPAHRRRFAETFAAERIMSIEAYRAALENAGFQVLEVVDLSDPWRAILHERLEMFRSLEAGTVSRYGQARHDAYVSNYEFFVQRIDAGDLGGGRFIARRD